MGPSGPETWWENRPNLVNRLFPYWESERVTVCWTLSLSLFTSLSLSAIQSQAPTLTLLPVFWSLNLSISCFFLSLFSFQSMSATFLVSLSSLSLSFSFRPSPRGRTWASEFENERARESERENKDAVRDVDAFAQMRGIFYKSYDSYSLLSYDEPRFEQFRGNRYLTSSTSALLLNIFDNCLHFSCEREQLVARWSMSPIGIDMWGKL